MNIIKYKGETMQVIHGAHNYQDGPLTLALGNFDGVHLAHKEIIQQTVNKASREGTTSAVFILDPHPVRVLYPQKTFLMLSSLQERIEMLEQMGIDFLIVEEFTTKTSQLSPFCFVRETLVECLKAENIIVGFDYTFGRRGRGRAVHLLKWGERLNFNVEIVKPVIIDNEVVSSSLIKGLISQGKVYKASRYLGYYFRRKGTVVGGEGRGKALGYPTANLKIPGGLILPQNGVYLSMVEWRGGEYYGVTNVGVKPTFHTGGEVVVEIYLLDFNEDIYGEELIVRFLHRIREEKAFSSGTLLKDQIEKDVQTARKLLSSMDNYTIITARSSEKDSE